MRHHKLREKKHLLWLAAALVLLAPVGVRAAFLAGENLRETTEPVEGDLYIAGNTVAVLHPVRDDVMAFGERVSIEAPAGGDIVAAGSSVRISGQPGDDVLAAGNDVRIAVERVDDIMAAGATVEIDSSAIAGSVLAAGQKVTISGIVAGDVRVAGDSITVKSGTRIEGNLVTFGQHDPIIEDGVSVTGDVEHRQAPNKAGDKGRAVVADWVGSVVAWFITGLVLLYLLRGTVAESVARALSHSGRSLGIGALAAAVVLPAFTLLALTLIGLPLAFLLLLLTGAHLIAAYTLAAITIGVWTATRFVNASARDYTIRWQHVLLGAVVLKVIALLPVIGWLAALAAMLLAWGALLEVLWRRLRASSQTPANA